MQSSLKTSDDGLVIEAIRSTKMKLDVKRLLSLKMHNLTMLETIGNAINGIIRQVIDFLAKKQNFRLTLRKIYFHQ